MGNIARVTKGERPTLLEASKANELIDKINSLSNITIQKSNQDEVFVSSNGVSIHYKGGDGNLSGSGVDGFAGFIGFDGALAYEMQVEDGIITSLSETPGGINLGTGGTYNFLNANDHLKAYEIDLDNGFVKSIISKDSGFQGRSGFLELIDPSDITRTIRLLIRNGLISQVSTGYSNYAFASMEVCVDGVNQTKNIVTYASESNQTPPQPMPLDLDILTEFYTKQEADAKFFTQLDGDQRYLGINDGYTKQESQQLFVGALNPPFYTKAKSVDLFLQKRDADAKFVTIANNQQALQNLEQNLDNNLANAKTDLQNDINQNVKTLQLVDDQLQKNITENGEKIEGNEDKIADLEQAQRGHDQRISSLENASDDFYTKSEIDSIITDANQQLEDIAQTMQSGKCLEQIFNSLKLTIAEMQKQNGILENILNKLQNK